MEVLTKYGNFDDDDDDGDESDGMTESFQMETVGVEDGNNVASYTCDAGGNDEGGEKDESEQFEGDDSDGEVTMGPWRYSGASVQIQEDR